MNEQFETKKATLSRLIEAALAMKAGAVVVNGGCEVDLEEIQELETALREWRQ
jgi:S-methylmethionine-dependent homocysteine/selenocysteine methylase